MVALSDPPEHFLEEPFPIEDYTFIAPFYGDVDTRDAGTVWFTDPVATDSHITDRVADDIRSAFEDQAFFEPAYAVIATWDHVGYFKEKSDKVRAINPQRACSVFGQCVCLSVCVCLCVGVCVRACLRFFSAL